MNRVTSRNTVVSFVISTFAALITALPSTSTLAQPVTVVEYYNRVIDSYFITARQAEQAVLDSAVDFERTGMTFAANAANSICRFYISIAK